MMTDFRALCAELLSYIDYICEEHGLPGSLSVDRARAALSQPEPQGPPEKCWLDDGPELYPSPSVLDLLLENND
jgi:hypothetical protein